MYFIANDTAEGKRVSTFFTVVGKKACALLKDLLSPHKPSNKLLEDLVSVLKKHYEPMTLMIAE